MVEQADTSASRADAYGHEGSIPFAGTSFEGWWVARGPTLARVRSLTSSGRTRLRQPSKSLFHISSTVERTAVNRGMGVQLPHVEPNFMPHAFCQWVDRNYRYLMLAAMLIELLLLAYIAYRA